MPTIVPNFINCRLRCVSKRFSQIPFFLRRKLASTLLLPENKIRVIKPKVGGGFGGKIDMFAKDFCAAWSAMKLGRPVKFVYDREEVFMGARQRHPMYVTVKTGMMKDRTIHARRFCAYADGGAYNSTAPLMITPSCYFLMLPYRVPNLIYEGYHVYTNKPVGGAMRSHGIPLARFSVERQLDMIAVRMGIDPAELRIKNSVHSHEEHSGGFVLNTCGFAENVRKPADAIGWKEKRGKLPLRKGSRPMRGIIKTGKVTVVKMATAHDCGTALNHLLVERQLEGSIIGGMSQALYEEVVMEGGQVMNPSFLDYGMPTSMEMPDMESHEVETDDPVGPFGAKESGEGTQLAPAPAIVNAIYDAIGIDFNELPITPEKILKALEEKKGHISQGGER